MKSLNDIESGDDELFKAIKYLIQLCTSEFNDTFPCTCTEAKLNLLTSVYP